MQNLHAVVDFNINSKEEVFIGII